jgi:hypothetical protein
MMEVGAPGGWHLHRKVYHASRDGMILTMTNNNPMKKFALRCSKVMIITVPPC